KLVAMAHEEEPATATLAFVLGGALFAPLFLCRFVARYWKETRGWVFADITGILGFILSCIYLAPQGGSVRQGGRPAGDTVTLLVSNSPPGTARDVIMQKVGQLADPGKGSWVEGVDSAGKPTRYTLRPVSDPRAMARRITFGTVTSVSGTEIRVSAFPI